MNKIVNGRKMVFNYFSQATLRHSFTIKKCAKSDVLVYDMRHETDNNFKLNAECEQWLKENGFHEVSNFTEWQREQYRAWEKNHGDYYLFF